MVAFEIVGGGRMICLRCFEEMKLDEVVWPPTYYCEICNSSSAFGTHHDRGRDGD